MGLFGRQFANVVEWNAFDDDILFWKWDNDEIKRGSQLVIRQAMLFFFITVVWKAFLPMKESMILNLILCLFFLHSKALSLVLTAVCARKSSLLIQRNLR